MLRRDARTLAAMDRFCDELVAKGIIRKIADALEVEPSEILQWIRGLEPAERDPAKVAARLQQLGVFDAYFERGDQQKAAWQR